MSCYIQERKDIKQQSSQPMIVVLPADKRSISFIQFDLGDRNTCLNRKNMRMEETKPLTEKRMDRGCTYKISK